MTETLTNAPDTSPRAGKRWNVIVLNDNHNTFQGVAFALSSTLPEVDYDKGMRMADRIHSAGPGDRVERPPRGRPSSTGSGSRASA
jgi:ATP-dependent Clp protease adaptor protein ClpS